LEINFGRAVPEWITDGSGPALDQEPADERKKAHPIGPDAP
jgi:hypothetical protein